MNISIKKRIRVLTWWDGIHNSLCLVPVLDLESKEILWSSKLELGDVALLALFDGDYIRFWQVFFASSHNFNEFFQIIYLLWLYLVKNKTVRSMLQLRVFLYGESK